MIKRGAAIGIGTVLMVIGLGGLALLQTGVINPPQSLAPTGFTEVKPPEPALENAQGPQPAPQAGEGAPTAQPPASADLKPQKPIPVPQLGGGERRYPAQDRIEQQRSAKKESGLNDVLRHTARKAGSKSHAHKAKSRSSVRMAHPAFGIKPVVITFRFDPVRDRELYVARVHTGDKIKVNVRRVGMADGRVYLTYTRNIHSKEGVLVKVGTRYSMYRGVGYYPYERGYYVIEMKIYPGNRWNIKPRSFV